LFLCATEYTLSAGTIPISVEVRCDQDTSCRDMFKEYVRKAIEDSGTHVVVEDTAKPTLRMMLWIAKNSEGDVTRGYAISFVLLQSADRRLLKLNNRYCKTEEAAMIVNREIRDYVLR
jgi:hypothetical protein